MPCTESVIIIIISVVIVIVPSHLLLALGFMFSLISTFHADYFFKKIFLLVLNSLHATEYFFLVPQTLSILKWPFQFWSLMWELHKALLLIISFIITTWTLQFSFQLSAVWCVLMLSALLIWKLLDKWGAMSCFLYCMFYSL